MLFDRKLMAMEEKEKQEQEANNLVNKNNHNNQTSLVSFLKLHILIPFKLMLFYENKSVKDAK